jgi:hypothetical protein
MDEHRPGEPAPPPGRRGRPAQTGERAVLSPAFDIAEITIPIGFKPTSAIFERNDPTQHLINRIAKARNVEETEIVAEMNRLIKDGFDTHLLPPAALVLLAKKYNVPFEDMLDGFRQSVKNA